MALPPSEKEGIEGKTFVVTGGLGHVGSSLCLELVRRGASEVRAFDIRKTSPSSEDLKNHGVHCIQGDVVIKREVEKALVGADCVFHLASYGKSGKEILESGRIDEVNINGSRYVIEACLELGIERLVYMSSDKVVFGGKEIVNGDELLPYVPIDDHFDPYERSKSVAEQLVLKSNGTPLKMNNGRCLYACAVRPGTVYGPGEDTHLPRIVSNAKLGLLLCKIGKPNVKIDWIYVDNLVLALILASKALQENNISEKSGQPVAAGQPYFVSDGSPINTFEFIDPLFRSLDYDLPKFWLSISPALFVARIFAILYSFLTPWLNKWWIPQPLILPNEVYKVGVTHYFSTHKAEEELGYVPMVNPREGMITTIKYWQDRKLKSMDGPPLFCWILCALTMPGLTSIVLLDDIGPVPLIRSIGLFFLRKMSVAKFVFVSGSILHVTQGILAYFIAKRVDPANARAWFWQTTFLGNFSFRYILKRALRT